LNNGVKTILLGNINSEKLWESNEILKFPKIKDKKFERVLKSCERLMIFLAKEKDTIIVSEAVENNFIDYIKGYGFGIPTIEVVEENEYENFTLGEKLLKDTRLLEKLKKLITDEKEEGNQINFFPFQHTYVESRLMELLYDQKIFSYCN
jgi:hypothetical protein